jgi:hypothetical protein
MRTTPILFVAFALGSASTSCTSDLEAPLNYETAGGSPGTDSGGGPFTLACGDVPTGAVGAEFSHQPEVGGDGELTFTVGDGSLPMGLVVDGATGRVSGVPTEAGTFEFELLAVDELEREQRAQCEVTVNETLRVNLAVDGSPGCVTAGQTLNDFVVSGTGTGDAIVCDIPRGNGNGEAPDGVSVDPDSCAIQGDAPSDRFGTWVFIVRGTQNGQEVFLPYCVTNDDPGDSYQIRLEHDGEPGDDVLEPIVTTFGPDAQTVVGTTGSPVFEIEDAASCGANSCNYGFAFNITASPFEGGSFSLIDDALLRDGDDNPVGLTHGLTVTLTDAPEEFENRIWVLSISLDYCLAADSDTCAGVDDTIANGNGNLELGIVMVPR